MFKARVSCYRGQSEENGTVEEVGKGCIRQKEECAFAVASNLLKCSLNGKEEIRMLLIDLDL